MSAAVGLSAALTLAACSSGSKSASAPPNPRQALLAAATQSQKVTSATETLTIRDTGPSGGTTTGTIQISRKPAVLIGGDLQQTQGGTSTPIKMVLTPAAMYFSSPPLTSQLGKPWVKVGLSALSGSDAASLSQTFRSFQSNEFTNQAQLFAIAKNTHTVGTQTVDGVSTTEYAGSVVASQAAKALPAGLRQALADGLKALGNSTIRFREWIDGQHYLRKVAEVETVNGDTINTTINITGINQPVHITLPPASQTYTVPASGNINGNTGGSSGNGSLAAKVVRAPSGFTLSHASGARNGPVNAASFNQMLGQGNPAAALHFVRGYHVTYVSTSNNDSIQVFLFQLASPSDAALLKSASLSAAPGKPKADPSIPAAEDFDGTHTDGGMYDHGVIGSVGTTVYVIDEATPGNAPVPLVRTLARQQYAAL